MNIEDNKVVQFSYQLLDAQGTLIEASDVDKPQLYLHGHNNNMPAIEKALQGKKGGDEITVELSPEEGYGHRDESRLARVPIKHLLHAPKRLSKGLVVNINTENGPVPATILKVGKFNVDLDVNHPLAGQTVTFKINVLDVRDATAEEIEHGHAHGHGGHHH